MMSSIVYIASDRCFVQLDKPVYQFWFNSYKDLPTDCIIYNDDAFLTSTQKEIGLQRLVYHYAK